MTLSIIDRAASYAHRNPSEAQKESGNYRKGHVKFQGLDIAIENARGSLRRGIGADGEAWSVKLPAHYGYIKRTEGSDGDHVDVYIGPHHKSPHVFVVDQLDANSKEYDEHKVMLGFGSKKQAETVYKAGFSDGRGKDRIGHIAEMSMDEFKGWLKSDDTTEPIRGKYARGGVVKKIAENEKHKRHSWDGRARGPWDRRSRKAEGGAVTDPDVLAQLNGGGPKQVADPDVLEKLNAPDKGMLHAAVKGALKGATFNFSDELAGIRNAGPEVIPDFVGPIPARTLAGGARLAANYFTGKDPEAVAAYERARDEERQAQERAHAQHPYVHMAGEVAGSIPAMFAMPEAGIVKGAGLGKRMLQGAQVGAEYGALSGAGEGKDTNERVIGAGTGAASGIVGGAAAPVLGSVAGAAYDKFGKPIVSAVRGAMDPAAEASRRLAVALRSDQELIAAGKAEGMSPADWIAARHAGEPVTLADLGSSNTQSLLRSAANTSPEGRAVLEKAFNDRFAGQTERVADEVRGLVAGGANAHKTGDQLVAEYDRARVPAYKQAYREGDKEIISPEIERLMGSPTFENAMKSAVTSGKDRAIMEGYGAFNPSVSVENGSLKFTKTKPNGVPTYPNLQYWDSVKKELDGVAAMAKRSGDPQGQIAADLSKRLRAELDSAVPSYGNARGIAAQFFGESNALEAGQKLAGKKVDPKVIKDVMTKMKPDERDLFREGYASDWANRVIGNISDSRDITKAMFNSPNERARALAVFGPAGITKMQTRMTLETIMDGARKAMGNSTTARQLIEAGLAGGALGGYLDGDWKGALAGAASGAGARKALATEMASGARKLIGSVDSRTAKLVAELLTSNDPAKLQQGLRMAQKNQRIADGLRNLASRIALAGQSKAPIPRLQGPMSAGAQDENQKP